MEKLISSAKRMQSAGGPLPFSVYSSVREQRILNVPIIKPMLICVLDGSKKLGEIECPTGSFVLLSNRPSINMRNIPSEAEYSALIIEFEYDDFSGLPRMVGRTAPFVQGGIAPAFLQTLQQFVDWSAFAPGAMWPTRRKEILQLLYHLGYEAVAAVVDPPSLSHRLHAMIAADLASELHADVLAAQLAMSESTMRRKLAGEGTSLQEIKDRARLGYGLHLVQTTFDPIGRVADRCGYQSQSRFTDKFKQMFDVTPSELRRTRLRDSGENLAE